MGTRKTQITVHGVPVDIPEERMGAFFAKYGQVQEVSAVRSKAGIATGDIVLQVVLTWQSFQNIPYILTCREQRMFEVVEGRGPCCRACCSVGHKAKECPGKKAEKTQKNAPPTATVVEEKEPPPPDCLG